jgi:hypothetical protein
MSVNSVPNREALKAQRERELAAIEKLKHQPAEQLIRNARDQAFYGAHLRNYVYALADLFEQRLRSPANQEITALKARIAELERVADPPTNNDKRERLIAKASWWSGWCTDNDQTLPDLAKLGGFLLDMKHQMACDRPAVSNPGDNK